jgi:hypothetical protein
LFRDRRILSLVFYFECTGKGCAFGVLGHLRPYLATQAEPVNDLVVTLYILTLQVIE